MAEIIEPGVLQTIQRRKIKTTDIIVFAVLAIIIIALSATLISKLSLKHDVANARIVSDQVIAAIQKRDGAAAYKLGAPKFKSTYTAAQLTNQFKAVTIATLKAPTIDRQTFSSTASGKTVYFIYTYSALKVPYYIRTAITDENGTWQLTNISGNADESQLIIN